MQTEEKAGIEFTRVSNDSNGNPRYVCHFLNLLTDADFTAPKAMTEDERRKFIGIMKTTDYAYKLACKRANKIGGRKFHNKQYGGGIVFQSYNIGNTERDILKIVNG